MLLQGNALVPPMDVHNHGRKPGIGQCPVSCGVHCGELVLTFSICGSVHCAVLQSTWENGGNSRGQVIYFKFVSITTLGGTET